MWCGDIKKRNEKRGVKIFFIYYSINPFRESVYGFWGIMIFGFFEDFLLKTFNNFLLIHSCNYNIFH